MILPQTIPPSPPSSSFKIYNKLLWISFMKGFNLSCIIQTMKEYQDTDNPTWGTPQLDSMSDMSWTQKLQILPDTHIKRCLYRIPSIGSLVCHTSCFNILFLQKHPQHHSNRNFHRLVFFRSTPLSAESHAKAAATRCWPCPPTKKKLLTCPLKKGLF